MGWRKSICKAARESEKGGRVSECLFLDVVFFFFFVIVYCETAKKQQFWNWTKCVSSLFFKKGASVCYKSWRRVIYVMWNVCKKGMLVLYGARYEGVVEPRRSQWRCSTVVQKKIPSTLVLGFILNVDISPYTLLSTFEPNSI